VGNRNFFTDKPSGNARLIFMQQLKPIIKRSSVTGLYVGWIPGMPGMHSQGATLEELDANLKEVLGMLLEEGGEEFTLSSSSAFSGDSRQK
jgi:predicted RNase H-like HicB family nuclease